MGTGLYSGTQRINNNFYALIRFPQAIIIIIIIQENKIIIIIKGGLNCPFFNYCIITLYFSINIIVLAGNTMFTISLLSFL